MDGMLLRAFQTQVLLQSEFLLQAAEHVNQGLQRADHTFTFYGLQNLLNAAANISKALWGQRGKYTELRKPLRDSLAIDDASPLRKVTMRNNYEHFDERLDKWWNESPRHNMMDLGIMPRSAVQGIDPIDWFRFFDPITGDFTFWSEDFNAQDLVSEVQRILPKLREEASKPHWEK